MWQSKILENVGILEKTSIHHSYQVDLMTVEDVKVHQGITKGGPSNIFVDPCRVLALNFLDCCFLWAGWTNTAPTLPRVTSRHQLLSQVQCVNLRNNQKSPERGNNWSRPIIGQTWPYLKTVHSLSTAFWPPSLSRSSRKGTYIEPDNRKFCRGRQPIQKLESVFTVDIVYTIFFER